MLYTFRNTKKDTDKELTKGQLFQSLKCKFNFIWLRISKSKFNINYDTECSDDEKESANITQNNHHSVEVFADPNYNSSDNEDPRNDIYLV
jgi:hypothetical protein